MTKLLKLSDLTAFADTVDDVFMTCHAGNDKYTFVPDRIPSPEIMDRRVALNKEADAMALAASLKEDGFWNRLLNSKQHERDAHLKVRERAFSVLPEHVLISPEIAFYLASDKTALEERLKKAHAESKSGENLKNMFIDTALVNIDPKRMVDILLALPRGLKFLLEDMDGVQKAFEGHDFTVERIFNVYQLTEPAPGTYMLKRGKWDTEVQIVSAVAGVTKSVPTVVEKGLHPNLNLKRLEETVMQGKSRG
jgi:hypothetical protein